MDVTFRESVSFYGERTYLSDMFIDLDSPDMCEVLRRRTKCQELNRGMKLLF